MAISEEDRHSLYDRVQALLGKKDGATLMAHLPPVGWADVATKQDLSMLEARLEAVLHREVSGLKSEMNNQLRTLVFAVIGSSFTAVSLAFAAARWG